MLDHYLWGSCNRISPEAPVQVVLVGRESFFLGGAANVAANLNSLGAHPDLVGVAGADGDYQTLLTELARRGIGHESVLPSESRPTTVKRRVMAGSQQIVRIDHESTADVSEELQDQVVEHACRLAVEATALVLSDYAKGVLTPRVARAIIQRCRSLNVPVLVDPKGRDYEKYRGAFLVTPNRKEAVLATGRALPTTEAVLEAGRELRTKLDLDACVITMSEQGMAVFEASAETVLPTEAREVYDVTGAGDTVVAALAVAIAAGSSLIEASRFANAAASVAVGKVGSVAVTLTEVQRAIAVRDPLSGKILERAALEKHLSELRAKGKRIVFTNGCFDVLHAGHVRYLTQAAALGDVLIVALNDDASVTRLKGATRPINSLPDRSLVMASLAPVTFVTHFSEDTPIDLIRAVRPDVLVKGGDYVADDIVGASFVRDSGGKVEILPFLEDRSTSRTLERIVAAARNSRSD